MNTHPNRYFVLVSKKVPQGFFPFEIGQSDVDPWTPLDGWEHRSYEVPSPGSLESVDVTSEDVFIVEASGPLIDEIDGDNVNYGPIARPHSWGSGFRLICPNGDYITLEEGKPDFGGGFCVYEPEMFGLSSLKVWGDGRTGSNDTNLCRDLTKAVLLV